jgi:hypothetical protein
MNDDDSFECQGCNLAAICNDSKTNFGAPIGIPIHSLLTGSLLVAGSRLEGTFYYGRNRISGFQRLPLTVRTYVVYHTLESTVSKPEEDDVAGRREGEVPDDIIHQVQCVPSVWKLTTPFFSLPTLLTTVLFGRSLLGYELQLVGVVDFETCYSRVYSFPFNLLFSFGRHETSPQPTPDVGFHCYS